MRHIPPNPLPGLFTFNAPCLRWKILAGIKNQYGFPGHFAPYQTRYLNLLVTITTDNRPLGPSFGVSTVSQLFTIDPSNGARTPNSLNASATPLLNFPYNTGLPGSDPGSTWIIDSDTHYTHIVTLSDGVIVTVEGQLSTPYTLSQLEADASALIHAIDPATVPEFTLMFTTGGGVPTADPTTALPAQYMYGSIYGQNPLPIPILKAATWSSLIFGLVGPLNWQPNVYMKAIGYFAMAGKYCQQTYLVDYNDNPINNTCFSGNGTCGNQFQVTPPPLVLGQNAYVLITPNCQCSGG
jgi:hypothetical protein